MSKQTKYIIWFAAVVFGAAVLLPLVSLVFSSLFVEGEFTLANFSGVFQRSILLSILNSVIISTLVSLISVVVGCCFAFLFTKTDLPFKKTLFFLLLLPLLLPPYIVTVAWTDVWLFLGISKKLVYGLPAVVFILSTIYVPLATFIISGSLKNISASIEEAGLMMTDYKILFLEIILPLIRPALFSSFILIFILTISEFAVPAYLSVNVFTTEIFTQFTAFYNYSSAISYALILTAICLLLILPENYYLSQAPFVSFGKKSFRQLTISLKNKSIWLIIGFAYIIFVVFLPITMLVAQWLSSDNISFFGIVELLLPALKDSLLLSFLGAMLVTFLGFSFALMSVKYKIKAIDSILLFVFAIPAIVTGIALVKFYNTPMLNFVYGTSLIIIVAFVARFLFVSQKIISGGLLQIPDSFREAAILMGASPFYTFRKITFPLLADALFTSFFVILIFCVAELTTVIMVYPPGTSLLPVRIFTLMANAPQATISGMCLVALLFTLSLVAIMMGGRKILIDQQWKRSQ
ncbi:MAG: iron ABC transporter permease [Chlorobi bacterium]|nr:iron ABC transporter permease [Chlorobiota bacterium]